MKIKLIKITALAIVAIGLFLPSSKAQMAAMGDHPSIHGMFLFGIHKIYLSHLPMFHSPHDYQVILEVELSEEDKLNYFQAKRNNPSVTTYTLVPESFVLPQMIASPRPFKAQIYQGHFERGGVVIAKNVTVNISQIIYFKKFNPNEQTLNVSRYIYIGDHNEIFGIHIIESKPDFDHIVEVGLTSELVALVMPNLYMEVIFPTLPKKNSLAPSASAPPSFINTTQGLLQLKPHVIGRSLYMEVGDLSF